MNEAFFRTGRFQHNGGRAIFLGELGYSYDGNMPLDLQFSKIL